jgi:ligand-binding SRPBCC domain-containing protein
MIELERTTALRAAPAEVWRHVTSIDGINRELAPWLRMTVPSEARRLTIDDALDSLGDALIVSRVLLFGVLPVERMRLTIVALEPGHRFVEQSPMLTMRSWRHERTVEPTADGCRLSDRLSFEPLVRASSPLLRRLVGALFAHRHRRLVERFG